MLFRSSSCIYFSRERTFRLSLLMMRMLPTGSLICRLWIRTFRASIVLYMFVTFLCLFLMMEPQTGIEPATSSLQVKYSASWATGAYLFVYCVYFFLSFRPLPLFAALYVAVNEWQFGQSKSRLSSSLFVFHYFYFWELADFQLSFCGTSSFH